MATFKDAGRRLQVLYDTYNPEEKLAKDMEAGLDEFTRLKKKLHGDSKHCRTLLLERANLPPGSSAEIAQLSYNIRSLLKSMRAEEAQIRLLAEKALKKANKKKNLDDMAKAEKNMEVVRNVSLHIEECENMEKERVAAHLDKERRELLNHTETMAARSLDDIANLPRRKDKKEKKRAAPNPYESALPDIDDDPQVAADLQLIGDNAARIDDELAAISGGVRQLKDMALNIGEELDKQDVLLTTIDKKADALDVHMDHVNFKMKKALDGVMKADRFMMNCILACIVLALIGFVVSFVPF